VLIDSKENMRVSWDFVSKEFNLGISFSSYFSNIGRPFKDILDVLGLTENQPEIEKTFNHKSLEKSDLISTYSGVNELIYDLKKANKKIGIVTSKNKNKTEKFLKKFNLHFDIVETPNKILRGKPYPDHIINAMKVLEYKPCETLYIGDMIVDYQAAESAHVDFLHAGWGYGDANNSTKIVKSINELKRIIL